MGEWEPVGRKEGGEGRGETIGNSEGLFLLGADAAEASGVEVQKGN